MSTVEHKKCAYEEMVLQHAFRELSILKKRKVKSHLKTCKSCQQLYAQFHSLAWAMKGTKTVICPDSVVDKTLAQIAWTMKKRSLIQNLFGFVTAPKVLRPVVVTLCVLCMILIFRNIPRNGTTYSQAEILQAKSDVETALGYFGRAVDQTQKTLEERVIPARVIKPIQNSITIAVQSITNGG
jgi:hypothetical protein